MRASDKVRVALSPLYLVAGIAILIRGWHEPLAWLLGLLFTGYGVYRLALVKKAL
jgi:hypothetical protein